MNLWKRIKNVFTDDLVERKELIKKDDELLKAAEKPVNDVRGKPFSIDWGFLGIPFSVERIYVNDDPSLPLMTLIGYYSLINPSSEPREWYLPLDDKQHNELVESFNEWRAMWTAEDLLERTRNNND